MGDEKIESVKVVEKKPEVVKPAVPEKIRFMVWFTQALERFHGIKAHHFHSIQAFFQHSGLGGSEPVAVFDEGLKKFGYGRRK